MDNQEFYKMATSYLTANAIIGSAAAKMAQLNREEAAKAAEMTRFYSHYMSEKQLADKVGIYIMCDDVIGAYEFLNKSLRNEIIHDCQNQKAFKTHLPNLIEERKKKYRSFYQKLDMPMPSVINAMTAEEICSIMSVELLTPEQLKKHYKDKKDAEYSEKIVENLGLVFRAILIIGLLVLMIYLSTQ